MKTYDFVLRFDLPHRDDDPEDHLDALFEAGCDDAVIGTGSPGTLALDFSRQADTAGKALTGAVENILCAIPEARLTEVGPDLLNLSELAAWISDRGQRVTRQAIRKYAKGKVARVSSRFPSPAVSGSAPVWHLADVLRWMQENKKITSNQITPLFESALVARKFNAAHSALILDQTRDADILTLVQRTAS